MIKLLFNFIINLLATVIQIIVFPINALIANTLPDISDKIVQVTSFLSNIFDNMTWALSIIPTPVLAVLTFIVTCEIAKHTIKVSTHSLIRVWTVLQKIKFW